MHASFPAPAGFRIVSSEEIRDGQGTPARVIHPDPGLRITLEPERAMPRDWYQFELKFPPEGLVHVVARLSLAGEGVLWLRLPVLARNHFLAHFRLEQALESLTLIVTGSGRLTAPDPAGSSASGCAASSSRRRAARHRHLPPRRVRWWRRRLSYFGADAPGSIAIARGSAAQTGEGTLRCLDPHLRRGAGRARAPRRAARDAARRPLISIPAAAVRDAAALDRARGGVSGQIYPEWELIVPADP